LVDSINQPTTVLDITYQCNATCKYCQWGNRSISKSHLPIAETCLPAKTISALGTKRIVLSGGEPRLHPKLSQIISHYKGLVDSIVVISNGYGLCRHEIAQLIEWGATGVTVSLDSISEDESLLVRETPPNVHRQMMANLKDIGQHKADFEIGLNSVVSHVTANWQTIRKLLEFASKINADFVKFQPIFNDGYVGLRAPYLMLTSSDSQRLHEIAALLESVEHPPTNPPGFWEDIADLADGKVLSPTMCNLANHSVAIRNRLNICYWLNQSSFGEANSELEEPNICSVLDSFKDLKTRCKVDFHCFCTQGLSHIWRVREGSENEFS
jgi:molybdenum cofactor biosynthesis enzyme MoaA